MLKKFDGIASVSKLTWNMLTRTFIFLSSNIRGSLVFIGDSVKYFKIFIGI